jgi:hypothetical protein
MVKNRVSVEHRGRRSIVDATVCTNCGEQYFSLETVRGLQRPRPSGD